MRIVLRSANLGRSTWPRLKRSESEQRQPVPMIFSRHCFTRTFAEPPVAPAAHEAAVIEEELLQPQPGAATELSGLRCSRQVSRTR
jgi:hypothetical protein